MATAQQNAAFLDYFRRLFGGSDTVPAPAAPVPSPAPAPISDSAPAPVAAPAPWWGENQPDFVDFFSELFKDRSPPPPPAFDLTTYDWSLGSKNVRDIKGFGTPWYADTWTVDPLYIGLTESPNALKVYKTGWTRDIDDYSLINPSTGEFISRGYFGGPKYTQEPWGEWFRTNNKDWSGYVSDAGQWAKNLPKLGFKGSIFAPESLEFTPEAQTAIDKLKKQGYEFLYNPSTHNNYSVAVTPLETYKLNTEGTSFFEEVAPFLGILATPFLGPLAGALGGGLAGTVAANALVSGGIGALSGGDPLKSALTGGLTAGIGSLVSPIAGSIGADVLSSTGSQALADAVSGAVKAGASALPAGLISGDLSNVLSSALTGGATSGVTSELSDLTGLSQKDIGNAIKAVQNIDNPLALAGIASSYLPGPTMPGGGISENIQEGFFEPGGPGFMPTEYLDDAEVDRELQSLLGRYPAPPPPSDWFLGENIMSGIPEWDMAAVNAGLPIGNLEQDFFVAQTKEGPRIVDSSGNVGNFVNGEFVVDTGVTPNLSYAATGTPIPSRAPSPAAPAQNVAAPAAAKLKDTGMDLGALMAMLSAMSAGQQKPEEQYQLADVLGGLRMTPYGTYGA